MKTRGIVFEPEVSRDVQPGTTTLYDMSRFGNDGAMTNVTWVQLPSGLWVMSFNGSTSEIDMAGNSLNLVNNYSISLWVKVLNVAGLDCLAWWGEDAVGKRRSIVISAAAGGCLGFSGYGAPANIFSTTVVDDDVWHFVGATLDGSDNLILYADGLSVQTGAPALVAYTYSGAKLGHTLTAGEFYSGDMVMARVYNYILTPGQILQRYEATRRLFGQ